MDTVTQIINRLEGRLIPMEIDMGGQMPPGYEEKLQGAYKKRMRRRAHRILQSLSSSDRESILAFLKNEDEVREAKSYLEDVGYDETAVEEMNQMAESLLGSRETIINQAHDFLLDEHELMNVFVGGDTEARVSLERD